MHLPSQIINEAVIFTNKKYNLCSSILHDLWNYSHNLNSNTLTFFQRKMIKYLFLNLYYYLYNFIINLYIIICPVLQKYLSFKNKISLVLNIKI